MTQKAATFPAYKPVKTLCIALRMVMRKVLTQFFWCNDAFFPARLKLSGNTRKSDLSAAMFPSLARPYQIDFTPKGPKYAIADPISLNENSAYFSHS